MKKNENEAEVQREEMRRKVQQYDDNCLAELEEVFSRHKTHVQQLLEGGLNNS